jgi:hypothetical protein
VVRRPEPSTTRRRTPTVYCAALDMPHRRIARNLDCRAAAAHPADSRGRVVKRAESHGPGTPGIPVRIPAPGTYPLRGLPVIRTENEPAFRMGFRWLGGPPRGHRRGEAGRRTFAPGARDAPGARSALGRRPSRGLSTGLYSPCHRSCRAGQPRPCALGRAGARHDAGRARLCVLAVLGASRAHGR